MLNSSIINFSTLMVPDHGDDAALNVIERYDDFRRRFTTSRSLMVELFFSGGIAIATQMSVIRYTGFLPPGSY